MSLARHAGRYATDNATLEIRVHGATLRSTSRAGVADLIPLADSTFEARGLPGLRVSFERISGRDLMVARQHGVRGYLAQRIRARRIPWTWKRRLGHYEIVRSEGEYELTTPPRLYIDDGLLLLGFEFKMTDPPTAVTMVLEPISASKAKIAGLGRGKGELVTAKRSSLFWAGYELRRVRR